jgi:hypothetical protein
VSPELVGRFDFVFVGNLLVHLRDPIGALEAVRTVCDGQLMSLEPVSPLLSALSVFGPMAGLWRLDQQQWWIPGRRAHRTMVSAAGFDVVDSGRLHAPFGAGFPRRPLARVRTAQQLRFWAFEQRRGVPSQWVLARPFGH